MKEKVVKTIIEKKQFIEEWIGFKFDVVNSYFVYKGAAFVYFSEMVDYGLADIGSIDTVLSLSTPGKPLWSLRQALAQDLEEYCSSRTEFTWQKFERELSASDEFQFKNDIGTSDVDIILNGVDVSAEDSIVRTRGFSGSINGAILIKPKKDNVFIVKAGNVLPIRFTSNHKYVRFVVKLTPDKLNIYDAVPLFDLSMLEYLESWVMSGAIKSFKTNRTDEKTLVSALRSIIGIDSVYGILINKVSLLQHFRDYFNDTKQVRVDPTGIVHPSYSIWVDTNSNKVRYSGIVDLESFRGIFSNEHFNRVKHNAYERFGRVFEDIDEYRNFIYHSIASQIAIVMGVDFNITFSGGTTYSRNTMIKNFKSDLFRWIPFQMDNNSRLSSPRVTIAVLTLKSPERIINNFTIEEVADGGEIRLSSREAIHSEKVQTSRSHQYKMSRAYSALVKRVLSESIPKICSTNISYKVILDAVVESVGAIEASEL